MSAEPVLHPLEAPQHAAHIPPPGPSLRSPIPGMATAPGDLATASSSASAPEIHTERSLSASPIAASPSYNPASSTSSLGAKLEPSSSAMSLSVEPSATACTVVDVEPDAQILEALRNKDRLYVLMLGEQMEALIKERRVRIELTPSTSYQRLLVYRCSSYYRLSPEKDSGGKTITVNCRPESRIPTRRICELVPAEESTQPAFQIMRRTDRNPRGRQHSHPSSTAGEDADTSDVDASEAGSIGGVSTAASTSARRFKTIEEREAEYNEARSRIFMGFEEKKEKEKDMSANSSTFSLVSGSGSTSGGRGSSIGDLDDSASSAPTESEWSGPVARDKRDGRRGPGSTNSSVRSLRSSGASFNANGSGSSRNSRATSPSFTYPTLYEPASAPQYEQGQFGNAQPPPQPGYPAHYAYPPYQPHPPGQQYYYYPPYPYPPPVPAPHSDPTTPGGPEAMYQPPPNPSLQQPSYSPYVWSNSPPGQQPLPPPHFQPQHPPQPGMPAPHPEGQSVGHPMPPPMQNPPQYPQYAPGPTPYGYGMPTYYQQPYPSGAPMGPPPPTMPGQMYHPGPMPDPMVPHAGSGMDGPGISRTSSRNSSGHSTVNGKRGGPRTRGSWTYGPGVGTPGFNYNPSVAPNGMGPNDAYGPRLSTNMRRQSGASSAGSAGARTPADETSSTASSSTTSSSSRRTFTSTSTSSKHPLPARPDWAVGLKPQHSRHHDLHNNAASRTMSPARMGGGPAHHPSQQHQAQPVLQSNDFPPLSSGPSTRQPVVGGAWTNASMSRVMMPGPQGNTNSQGTALVHYPSSQTSSPQVPSAPPPAALGRLDEQDLVAFERPPPKNAELFNPKAGGRAGGNGGGRVENGRSRTNTGASSAAGLADRLSSMVLADAEGIVPPPVNGASNGDLAVAAIVVGETTVVSS